MTLRTTAILLACLSATISTSAQTPDFTQPYVFDPAVKSVQLSPESNWLLPPVIIMGGSDRINVSFDYLDYDMHYLRYSVYHCDAMWRPSQLVESEWVSGFNQADIEECSQSRSTFTQYCNYHFSLPNDEMQLLISGNYLLRVYEQDDPDHVLFQSRFALVENKVGVQATVTSRTDETYNDAHQQLDITLNFRPGSIADPYGELTTIIRQNTRTDNTTVLTHPLSVGIGTVNYAHQPGLIFNAGNEYRRFETVNAHSINMGVESIKYFEPIYHATLYQDEPRAETQYLYDQTQHGRFFIRNAESDRFSATEADYMITHFSLFTGERFTGGKVIVEGEFTDNISPNQKEMSFDSNSGCYIADFMLKQGAYNYQYLFLPDGTATARTDVIEGDKFQTINNYYISVYDRPSGGRYDQLVGFGIVRSGE